MLKKYQQVPQWSAAILVYVISLCLAISLIWQAIFLPEPYTVDLPEFKGSIFEESAVRILREKQQVTNDFSDIATWTENSLMTYGGSKDDPWSVGLRIKVLSGKPNELSYTEQNFPVPRNWGIWHRVGVIEKEGQHLIINSAIGESWAVLMMAVLMSGLATIILPPVYKRLPGPS